MQPRSNPQRGLNQRSDMVKVDWTKLLWHIQRSTRSKSAFADHCGIGRTSLHRIERGQAVQRSTVQQIATTLNIAISLPSAVLFLFMTLISTYFISSDREKIGGFLQSQLPAYWITKFHAIKGNIRQSLLHMLVKQRN